MLPKWLANEKSKKNKQPKPRIIKDLYSSSSSSLKSSKIGNSSPGNNKSSSLSAHMQRLTVNRLLDIHVRKVTFIHTPSSSKHTAPLILLPILNASRCPWWLPITLILSIISSNNSNIDRFHRTIHRINSTRVTRGIHSKLHREHTIRNNNSR
jgi:hypothetical protein